MFPSKTLRSTLYQFISDVNHSLEIQQSLFQVLVHFPIHDPNIRIPLTLSHQAEPRRRCHLLGSLGERREQHRANASRP